MGANLIRAKEQQLSIIAKIDGNCQVLLFSATPCLSQTSHFRLRLNLNNEAAGFTLSRLPALSIVVKIF